MLSLLAIVLSLMTTTPSSVSLAWDANGETDVATWMVQMATQPGGPYHDAAATSVPAGIVSGLLPGRYYFVVRAINTRGFWSDPSNEVTVALSEGPPAPTAVTDPDHTRVAWDEPDYAVTTSRTVAWDGGPATSAGIVALSAASGPTQAWGVMLPAGIADGAHTLTLVTCRTAAICTTNPAFAFTVQRPLTPPRPATNIRLETVPVP